MAERSFPSPMGRQARGVAGVERPEAPAGWLALPSALLVGFIVVPLLVLVWRSVTSPGFWAALSAEIVLQALWVTAISTALTLATVAALGTPLAYLLARRRFRGKWLVDLAVDLPLVLPPVVAGVALLLAFGRRGLFGPPLQLFGIELPFTLAAVVLAQVFVASPFYVRSARVGFAGVEPAVEEAAAIDGASAWQTFRLVTAPLALPGIAGGAVLCFGRALSEFGATLMFAGNFMGTTQTMALAIMQAMEVDLTAALALAVLLVLLSGLVLVGARLLAHARLGD
jgi:molybdate transport system permease protein